MSAPEGNEARQPGDWERELNEADLDSIYHDKYSPEGE